MEYDNSEKNQTCLYLYSQTCTSAGYKVRIFLTEFKNEASFSWNGLSYLLTFKKQEPLFCNIAIILYNGILHWKGHSL